MAIASLTGASASCHSIAGPWRLKKSDGILGIMFPNPLLNKVTKLLRPLQQILGFRLGSGIRAVVIDLVSLPSASIEIRHQSRCRRSHRKFERFESRQVVSGTDDTVAGAGNHYLGQLKGGVVRCRKAAVGRQRLHAGIPQVTFNDVPQILEFLSAGLMRSYALRLK